MEFGGVCCVVGFGSKTERRKRANKRMDHVVPCPIRMPIITVDSTKLEYGHGTIDAGSPSSQGFGVGGQSYSNFLASIVWSLN